MKKKKSVDDFTDRQLRMWAIDRAIEIIVSSGDYDDLLGTANRIHRWIIGQREPISGKQLLKEALPWEDTL